MKPQTKENGKYYIGIALLIALIGITFYFVFKNNPIGQMIPIFRQVRPVFVICGLLAVLVYEICDAINMRSILKTIGVPITFWAGLKYAFVGFYFSAITPSSSGGQPAQVYYMQKDKIEVSYSSLTLLIIISIYQIVMLLYACLAFFMNSALVKAQMAGMDALLAYGVAFNLISIAALAGVIFSKSWVPKIVYACIKALAALRLVRNKDAANEKAQEQLQKYRDGVLHIKAHPSQFYKSFLLQALQMTAMLSVPYFVYLAFGLSGVRFIDVLSVQALVNIAVAALPLPGSVGAAENVFLILFRSIFGARLLAPAMVLSRSISFYFYLLLSGIVCIAAYGKILRREHLESIRKGQSK